MSGVLSLSYLYLKFNIFILGFVFSLAGFEAWRLLRKPLKDRANMLKMKAEKKYGLDYADDYQFNACIYPFTASDTLTNYTLLTIIYYMLCNLSFNIAYTYTQWKNGDLTTYYILKSILKAPFYFILGINQFYVKLAKIILQKNKLSLLNEFLLYKYLPKQDNRKLIYFDAKWSAK
jgi:hypothetical protein